MPSAWLPPTEMRVRTTAGNSTRTLAEPSEPGAWARNRTTPGPNVSSVLPFRAAEVAGVTSQLRSGSGMGMPAESTTATLTAADSPTSSESAAMLTTTSRASCRTLTSTESTSSCPSATTHASPTASARANPKAPTVTTASLRLVHVTSGSSIRLPWRSRTSTSSWRVNVSALIVTSSCTTSSAW